MGSQACFHSDGQHPLASWLFQAPGGFDPPWLKSRKPPGGGHVPLDQGIIPRKWSKRVLNARLCQICNITAWLCTILELKRGFVNSFHVHLKAERANKCEIKILTELISLNLSLINYRVCNNSLGKSIPQTCKAWRAVRCTAKQQGFIRRPRFPLKINPSAWKVGWNGHTCCF